MIHNMNIIPEKKPSYSRFTDCDDGHFGVFCDGICHCDSGSCNKTTGHCSDGCATGWSGDNCQTGMCHCTVSPTIYS